ELPSHSSENSEFSENFLLSIFPPRPLRELPLPTRPKKFPPAKPPLTDYPSASHIANCGFNPR
ncbi:MAG: hypothetical protein K2I89_10325, partial [Muribaculaceae bacterium]|nr:hypothetical protein [Muribaculaceae bacterium]